MSSEKPIKVLIVDDKEKLCTILAKDFNLAGYESAYALNSEQALKIIPEFCPDAVLLDLKLGSENGLDLLEILKERYPGLPVIMVTGYGSIDNAVKAVKLGAWDYIQKPANFTKIHRTVTNAASQRKLERENSRLKKRIIRDAPDQILSGNMKMGEILGRLRKLASRNFPILITGESGTGKELFAEYIHGNSERKLSELYKINCAAIAHNLLDNELFGHEKGAYTGANEVFKGIFERADGGTLFLDELGDMPLEIQAKILRTLQNHEVRRLGGKNTIKVDVRIIAATNKNIGEMVEKGTFREDLYYRLNLAEISIPPLRERKEDIELLARTFLEDLSENWGTHALSMSDEVMDLLKGYDWPGNVRELKNVIHYMATVAGENVIGLRDLPQRLLSLVAGSESPLPANPRENLEEKMIRETLSACRYNKKLTAEKLRMSRKTLYNKLAKYGIEI